MPTRVIFRCDFCSAAPDPETQRSLERALRELAFGQYLEAPPGRWLVWLGGGPLGPRRYSCASHRGELTAYLREHYGHLGEKRLATLTKQLTSIETGEMVPFYIQRYGFYEGHVPYRADPIAIATVFGLMPLQEIDAALDGNLDGDL